MPNSFCLLCLTNVDDGPVPSPAKKLRNSKSNKSRSIKIGTLFELIRPFWPHPIMNKYEEHETCSLCGNCSLATREAEEIRDQISKLETRLREKVDTIKGTILDAEDTKEIGKKDYQDEFDRILAIRGGLMDENKLKDKGVREKVKVEPAQEDFEDNFLDNNDDNNDPPFSPSGDDYYTHDKDSDSDSDYCIKPGPSSPRGWSPKRKKSSANSPSKKQNNADTEFTPSESPVKQETTTCRRSTRSTKPRKFDSLEKFFDDDVRLTKTRAKKRKLSTPSKRYVPKYKKPNPPTDWKCPICARYSLSEEDLNIHQARLKRPCPLCPSTFCSNNDLLDHIKETHDSKRPYRCQLCVKKTTFRHHNALDQHMYMKHETGEKTHTCSQCDKKFSLEYNLERHVKLHKLEKTRPFVCDVCDSRYSSREVLETHEKFHMKLRCNLCDFETFKSFILTKHNRIHTGEKPFKCPHCEESFIDNYYRKTHIFRVHETTPSHQCHICAKNFFAVGQLNAHLKKHERNPDEKPSVPCSTCGKEFKTVLKMQTHRVLMHGDEPYICDECGGSYVSLSALRNHKSRHAKPVTTEKLFKCDLCDASFVTKQGLTGHTQTHTNEVTRHDCPNCGYSYRSKSHLLGHRIRIHNMVYEEETTHKCTTCENGFPSKRLLEWHIRNMHTGDGPKFPCTHCDAAYADSTMLTWHIRGHHGIMVGGLRKHSKTWKVKPKQKKGTIAGLSSHAGGSIGGQPVANNSTESVVVDDAIVWGMDHTFFG